MSICESHRVACFLSLSHPKVQYQPCRVEIFVTGSVQVEFGLPSVGDLGERVLSLKREVGIRKL